MLERSENAQEVKKDSPMAERARNLFLNGEFFSRPGGINLGGTIYGRLYSYDPNSTGDRGEVALQNHIRSLPEEAIVTSALIYGEILQMRDEAVYDERQGGERKHEILNRVLDKERELANALFPDSHQAKEARDRQYKV